mmetsp:Transcript_24303/g.74946  ORF Transcript_24303/g.74946 Transcript_24303/m.74946 type:complete len:292 (-) Transcript_24303:318-1193(-)
MRREFQTTSALPSVRSTVATRSEPSGNAAANVTTGTRACGVAAKSRIAPDSPRCASRIRFTSIAAAPSPLFRPAWPCATRSTSLSGEARFEAQDPKTSTTAPGYEAWSACSTSARTWSPTGGRSRSVMAASTVRSWYSASPAIVPPADGSGRMGPPRLPRRDRRGRPARPAGVRGVSGVMGDMGEVGSDHDAYGPRNPGAPKTGGVVVGARPAKATGVVCGVRPGNGGGGGGGGGSGRPENAGGAAIACIIGGVGAPPRAAASAASRATRARWPMVLRSFFERWGSSGSMV